MTQVIYLLVLLTIVVSICGYIGLDLLMEYVKGKMERCAFCGGTLEAWGPRRDVCILCGKSTQEKPKKS
jgi:hypothetical protein